MLKRLTVLLKAAAVTAAAVMMISMAGCSEDKEKVSASDMNRTETGEYYDNGETFCRGVWTADNGENRVGYYIFYDGDSGRFEDAQYGMGVPFEVKTEGNRANFNLGAVDFSDPAKVENTDKGRRTLVWESDGRTEYLTLLGGYEPDSFSYCSQNDLSDMAMDYYENQNGKRPEAAEISIGSDGMALIQLFGKVGKNGSLLSEYEIDSITGKGTVKDTGEEIALVRNTDQ